MDRKKSTREALERYYERQAEQIEPKPKRKNEKPEKQVEQEVLLWCKQHQFDVDVVEAKAKFNTQTMRYTGRAASPGMSDIIGNTFDGQAVFIELKSKGRRVGSALDPKQRMFLMRKIQTGCFAIMCDSIEYIDKTWTHFNSLPEEQRIAYLLNELPQHNERQLKFNQNPGTADTGDDDLPF